LPGTELFEVIFVFIILLMNFLTHAVICDLPHYLCWSQ